MTVASKKKSTYSHRVLILEDDDFTRSMLAESLSASGYLVQAAGNVSEASEIAAVFEPNVVIADLNLGAGPNGLDYLIRVNKDSPWVGLIALSSHASPELATGASGTLPKATIYLVKSELESIALLREAIERSFTSADDANFDGQIPESDRIAVTPSQAEIIWLMEQGLSNAGIAERRNTSVRAAEAIVQRTIASLGIEADGMINPRVMAINLWLQGKIVVR